MLLLLSLLIVSAGTAYILLTGLTAWWRQEMVRGFIYVTAAIMIIFMVCVYSVVTSMENVFDEKVRQYGGEVVTESVEKWRRNEP